MKLRLLLLTVLAFATASLLAFRFNDYGNQKDQKKNIAITTFLPQKSKTIIRCGPDWEQLRGYLEENSIPPIAGAGTHKWKITTYKDSAQFYFNQGINMYYSFHIIESMASFKKAASFDPNSAMLQWAQALAYGPNINDVGYAASPDALQATNKAKELSANCNSREKMLIEAMLARYSADSTQSREKLNQLYVDKMKAAYSVFPNDADIAALYADALMLQHPWDLWSIDGTPKPWTPEIRTILEKLLLKFPNHPGANHYYIHVMEPSPYFAKALPSADRLGKITPALSHTVHMPSHIYLRVGQYDKGVMVNERAVNSYKKMIPAYGAVTGNDFLYLIHNVHMQTNNAMLAGKSDASLKAAKATAESISDDYLAFPGGLGNYIQYVYMTPVLVDIRFGNWEELLRRDPPKSIYTYATLLDHFGKGMAYAGYQRPVEANDQLKQLRELMKDSSLYAPFSPFSPAIDGAKIAEHLLAGSIALVNKNYTDAIDHFKEASAIEENMVYNEPRDWMLNPKHYLGFAYLKAGQYADAEKIFQKDLLNNNDNVWALIGLYQSLINQKKKEAVVVKLKMEAAKKKADLVMVDPVF
ncbi:MAG TPA: tetratricopeptide repeat protein [Chitinophagaceae bacterium]|jgi:tetratricopeptide (TPR) repeat protein|nr:tetratricopeptide repeat protein [Chitinophagaceae bacterium]